MSYPPLERACDFVKQLRKRLLTERINCADNYQGYESGHQCVFDGGGAATVAEKASHKRSRSMGTSGASAGGIGYSFIWRG